MNKSIFATIEELLPPGLTEDEKKYHHARLTAIQKEHEAEKHAKRLAYHRQRRQEHPELFTKRDPELKKKYDAKYRETHREEIRARAKEHHKKYKEKIKQKTAERKATEHKATTDNQKHILDKKAYNAKYYEIHGEEIRSKKRQHSKTNRASAITNARTQRNRHIDSGVEEDANAAAIAGVIVGEAISPMRDPTEQLFADFQAFNENQENQENQEIIDSEEASDAEIGEEFDAEADNQYENQVWDNFEFDPDSHFGGKRTRKNNKKNKKNNKTSKRNTQLRKKTRKY